VYGAEQLDRDVRDQMRNSNQATRNCSSMRFHPKQDPGEAAGPHIVSIFLA